MRRRAYHGLVVAVLGVADHLPLAAGRRLGRGLARLAVAVRSRERDRALTNLSAAFPDLSAGDRESLLTASALALGENFFDTLAAGRLLERDGFVTEEVPSLGETLRRAAAAGRGVLVLTGHVGCWELLGGWLARTVSAAGLGQLAVVTGEVHNAPVDRLLQERRRALGMKILPRSAGAKPLLRHLQRGGVAAVLLDQNTRVENRPVPFFGQPAPTPVGFARIALRYGVPVLPVVLARRGDGHEVRTGRSWRPEGPAPDGDPALSELLAWCNLELETQIRRNPAEWVWFHKRWAEPACKEPKENEIET